MHPVTPRMMRPSDRLLVVAVAAWALGMGVLSLLDRGDGDVFLAPLFPWLFIAAALAALAYAAHPTVSLKAWSGASLVTVTAGRGLGLIFGLIEQTSPVDGPRVLVGIGVWSMLSFALGVIWRLLIPPDGRRGRSLTR